MRENRDFVVPVNILTTFAHAPFLGPHDTLPCVLIMYGTYTSGNDTHCLLLSL